MRGYAWLVGVLMLLSVATAHAGEVEYRDIRCYLVSDNRVEGFASFHRKDRSGTEVDGFISPEPFLTSEHLQFQLASVGRSRGGQKKGKAMLNVPLTEQGRTVLEDFTEGHIGYRVAIFSGDELVAAPKIMEKFSGPLPLEGGYTDEEAQHVVEALRASE